VTYVVKGRATDLRLNECELYSRLGRYQVVPQIFIPSGVGKWNTDLLIYRVKTGRVHLCWMADKLCDPIWPTVLRELFVSWAQGSHDEL